MATSLAEAWLSTPKEISTAVRKMGAREISASYGRSRPNCFTVATITGVISPLHNRSLLSEESCLASSIKHATLSYQICNHEAADGQADQRAPRSEEHTSELQ